MREFLTVIFLYLFASTIFVRSTKEREFSCLREVKSSREKKEKRNIRMRIRCTFRKYIFFNSRQRTSVYFRRRSPLGKFPRWFKRTRGARSSCQFEGVNIKGAFVRVASSSSSFPIFSWYPPGRLVTRFSPITTPCRSVCIIQHRMKHRPSRLIQTAITFRPSNIFRGSK